MYQYLTNIDETPAKMGGKENYWRKLTLDGKHVTHVWQSWPNLVRPRDMSDQFWRDLIAIFKSSTKIVWRRNLVVYIIPFIIFEMKVVQINVNDVVYCYKVSTLSISCLVWQSSILTNFASLTRILQLVMTGLSCITVC